MPIRRQSESLYYLGWFAINPLPVAQGGGGGTGGVYTRLLAPPARPLRGSQHPPPRHPTPPRPAPPPRRALGAAEGVLGVVVWGAVGAGAGSRGGGGREAPVGEYKHPQSPPQGYLYSLSR